MKRFLCVMVGILLMFLPGCVRQEEIGRPVTLVLDWTPNTNHTGIYVALEKGFFQDENLRVIVVQPTEGAAEQAVASNVAQFGISFQETVTFARAAGMPIVSIAAVIQHNTSGFGSLKEKGILGAEDFEGKIYGGWGGEVEKATLRYIMNQVGADFSKVEFLTVGDIDFFTASAIGSIDFAWVFEGWTLMEASIRGLEMNYIPLAAISEVFDYYTPVIITNENNIAQDREMVAAFMRAVRRGYEFAISHPEEAAEILLKHVPELDRELVQRSQAFLSERYQADAPYWGFQDNVVWQRYMEWLHREGFLNPLIRVEDAFTNEFTRK